MKKEQVKVGSTYRAKVSGSVVPVRITAEKWSGDKHVGWAGTNTETGRSVRVKSAQRLRSEVGGKPDPEPPTPAAAEPVPTVAPDAVAAPPAATAANVGQPAGDGAAPLAEYVKSDEAAANAASWDLKNIPDHGRSDGTPTAKARRKAQAKGVAAADQESARARDERAAAPDGMTASERAMAQSAKKASPAPKAAKAKKPAAGKSAKAPSAKAPKTKPAKAEKPKRPSALDAAAQVLAGAGEPMNVKDIFAKITSKGLWKSPVGKTPEASIYAAIIREIAAKGRESRFKKSDRGLFAATGRGG